VKRFLPALMAILAVAGSCVLLAPIAVADPSGSFTVSQSGTGIIVRLVNPKDGAAATRSAYSADAGGCNGQKNPCYIFSAVNGAAPMAVQSDACQVKNAGGSTDGILRGHRGLVDSNHCIARRNHRLPTRAAIPRWGNICLPASVTYEAGGGVFSILAHDGCAEKSCVPTPSTGTVDADSKDSVDSRCKFVQRH